MDAYHQQWLSFKETAAALADLKKKGFHHSKHKHKKR